MKTPLDYIQSATKRSSKNGLEPGSLVYIGESEIEETHITLITYNKTSFDEQHFHDHFSKEIFSKLLGHKENFYWIHVHGLKKIELLKSIAEQFHIDSLILEDILNTDQRPKVEELEKGLYFTLKLLLDVPKNHFIEEQVSMYLYQNVLISFSDADLEIFHVIKEKVKNTGSKIRQKKIDFLMYSLLDMIVDKYFIIIENMNESINLMEEKVIHTPDQTTIQGIQNFKKDILRLKRVVFPLKEAVHYIEKIKIPMFEKESLKYLRDLSDHVHYVSDYTNSLNESINIVLEIYLSSINNRTNQVVKVLTLLTSIFIPLTFIVGIYGMNFKNMPEIDSKYGYSITWVVMIIVAIGMIFYFKKRKWL